jgi:peptidoglycan hydrolase-like protein with peptidoglycan-binding domain
MNIFTITFLKDKKEHSVDVAVNDDKTSVDAINKVMTLNGIKSFSDINSCVPTLKVAKDDISFFTFMSNIEARYAHSALEANTMLSTILHETYNIIQTEHKQSFWTLPSVQDNSV